MAMRLYDASEAGADGYPLAWHETIKHLVRQQAGNRCVRCKHPYQNGEHWRGEWTPCDEQCEHAGPFRFRRGVSSEWILREISKPNNFTRLEAQWRILTVHHLSGQKLDCRWWNLAALCQRCHLTIQGRVKMHRPWLLDHSEWFKPYVAGYYAWQFLGQELAREVVLERLDELLLLGRGGVVHA